MSLPECGLYRTTASIGRVMANHLVYFHNHGNPGPGVYLPESWEHNRAKFSSQGVTLPDISLAETLEPLAPQGFYRVEQEFTCCEKNCRTFAKDLLVQLGYNAHARGILFLPEWSDAGLSFPETGEQIDPDRVARLSRLSVHESHERGKTTLLH